MGDTFKKVGSAISKSAQILSPIGGRLVKKGLEAANMRPDDPLNLAPRTGGTIPDAPPTAAERYYQQRLLITRRGG